MQSGPSISFSAGKCISLTLLTPLVFFGKIRLVGITAETAPALVPLSAKSSANHVARAVTSHSMNAL